MLTHHPITAFYRAMADARRVFLERSPQYERRTMTRDEWCALSALVRLQYRLGIETDEALDRWVWKQRPALPGDTDPRSDALRWRLERLPNRWTQTPDDSYDSDIPF
ncbi:hypothetical protein HW932_18580 [Allochromatium humboldtianum]|uniref:Uncharacterized protein n=1 Tax=Allochromatium humboldtianum TaxID=504901 RepID=A0A850RK55_9GAMM|nr:hypothetical protein [Allochromatium humboldtianum]NVZ11260.1 hypothetical protein [Allochromatium humboldtianum]